METDRLSCDDVGSLCSFSVVERATSTGVVFVRELLGIEFAVNVAVAADKWRGVSAKKIQN